MTKGKIAQIINRTRDAHKEAATVMMPMITTNKRIVIPIPLIRELNIKVDAQDAGSLFI
jgi:hypothetical protein